MGSAAAAVTGHVRHMTNPWPPGLGALCRYCWERPRNTRIATCGHMALCEECARTVSTAGFACLVCQAAFTLASVVSAHPSEDTYVPVSHRT